MAMQSVQAKLRNLSIDENHPYKNITKTYLDRGSFGEIYHCQSETDESIEFASKEINVSFSENHYRVNNTKIGGNAGLNIWPSMWPIKIPKMGRDHSMMVALVDREEKVMETLLRLGDHSNVAKIFFCKKTISKLLIFMEYMKGGDLTSYIYRVKNISGETILKFLAQILSGLKFLHSNGVVHYDMKTKNILVDDENNPTVLKITDYGTSKNYEVGVNNGTTVGYKGTKQFMAPEVLATKKNDRKPKEEQNCYDKKSDLWAVGIIGLHLMIGDLSWKNAHEAMTIFGDHQTSLLKDNARQNKTSDSAPVKTVRILTRLLVVDPKDRCDADEANDLIESEVAGGMLLINIGSDRFILIDRQDPYSSLIKDTERLGTGHFGTVYRCKSRQNESFECAVKEVHMPNEYLKEMAQTEKFVVKKLAQLGEHSNIVKMFFVHQTTSKISFFMEFMKGGDLDDYIDSNGAQNDDTTLKFLKQIVAGLKFLHSNGIAHQDMKSANILLDNEIEPSVLKICDYGLSNSFPRGNETIRSGYRGIRAFVAPEVEVTRKTGRTEPRYDTKSDIWSTGVIGWLLVFGSVDHKGSTDLFSQFKRYEADHPNSPVSLVLREMLVIEPQYRCNAAEAMNLLSGTNIKISCEIPSFFAAQESVLKAKLIDHFSIHNDDEDVIGKAVDILRYFGHYNWLGVSYNEADDIGYLIGPKREKVEELMVKVEARRHLFYWPLNRPEWGTETAESVRSCVEGKETAEDVRGALDEHFGGRWICVISSTDDTKVHGTDVVVRSSHEDNYVTIIKRWNL